MGPQRQRRATGHKSVAELKMTSHKAFQGLKKYWDQVTRRS